MEARQIEAMRAELSAQLQQLTAEALQERRFQLMVYSCGKLRTPYP